MKPRAGAWRTSTYRLWTRTRRRAPPQAGRPPEPPPHAGHSGPASGSALQHGHARYSAAAVRGVRGVDGWRDHAGVCGPDCAGPLYVPALRTFGWPTRCASSCRYVDVRHTCRGFHRPPASGPAASGAQALSDAYRRVYSPRFHNAAIRPREYSIVNGVCDQTALTVPLLRTLPGTCHTAGAPAGRRRAPCCRLAEVRAASSAI